MILIFILNTNNYRYIHHCQHVHVIPWQSNGHHCGKSESLTQPSMQVQFIPFTIVPREHGEIVVDELVSSNGGVVVSDGIRVRRKE